VNELEYSGEESDAYDVAMMIANGERESDAVLCAEKVDDAGMGWNGPWGVPTVSMRLRSVMSGSKLRPQR
jgi:hypothetical protein